LLAKKRGLYGIGINWHEVQQRRAAAEKEARRRMPANNGSLTPIKIKTILSPSPNKGKVRRKPRTGNIGPNSEPTVTFHTRAATDDIYGIFNQPIQKKTINEGEGIDSGDDSDVSEGDYTATITSSIQNHTQEVDDTAESVQSDFPDDNYSRNASNQNKATQDVFESEDTTMMPVQIPVGKMEKLSIFADEPTHPPARKLQIPEPPPNFNPPTNPFSRPADRHLPFMTPIVERTETLPMTALKNRAMQEMQTPSRSALGMPAIMDDDDEDEEEEEEEGSEDEDEDEEMGDSPFNKKNLFSPPPKPKPFSPPPQRPMGRPPLGIKSSKLVPLGTKPQPPVQPVAAPVQKPIIDDIVCNPLDEGMRKTVFQKLSPPLKTYPGYYESTTRKSTRAAIVQKYVRSLAKTESGKTASIPKAPLIELFTPNGVAAYTVCRELGRGAFAPVYLVENHVVGDLEEEAEEAGIDPAELKVKLKGRQRFEALKMEDPPNAWEFYLIRQTKMRLAGTRMADSIINVPEMHLFEDEMFLFLEYRGHGSMLDLVNYSKSEAVASGGTGLMDELLVMFLSVELLRTVEAMHATGLIHGDLKADNALARFDPVDDAKWDSNYHPDGSGGWSSKGILLIDFGRAIDMKLFRPEVQFIADWETDHQDCAEMREMRPWTYQVDYHGLAAIIHSLLFGRYIETTASKSGLPGVQSKHYKITQPLKRYWQKEIWTEVFDVLLNPLQYVAKEQTGAMPINSSLRMIRERMEVYLENNCAAGIGLKGMLKKMEGALTKRK
jgi:checkpoint serine/threonine-protein kinase